MVLTEAYQAPIFPSGRDNDGFNLGCYDNFVEVFGSDKRLWLLPVHSRLIVFRSFRLIHGSHTLVKVQSKQSGKL